MKTLVLGAGLAGLVAAWHFQRRGEALEIWEATDDCGGWAKTLEWPGPQGESGQIELGPQELLWQRGSAVDRLMNELSLSFDFRGPRKPRWIAQNGRLVKRPAQVLDLLTTELLSPASRWRMLLEPFQSCNPSDHEESVEAFFERRLGKGFARDLLPYLVSGILGSPPDSISADAIPMLRRMERHGGLLMGALREGRFKPVIPRGGVGALARCLTSRLPAVKMNLRAESLERSQRGGWQIQGRGAWIHADRVLLALPAFEAARLLGSVAPMVAQAMKDIRYLDLDVWHSRHALSPTLHHGFSLHGDPRAPGDFLGALALSQQDPRGVPGSLQVRTYARAGSSGPDFVPDFRDATNPVQTGLPFLSCPMQMRCVRSQKCFPVPAPGQVTGLRQASESLPSGLHWVGIPRFGMGLKDAFEGLEEWSIHL